MDAATLDDITTDKDMQALREKKEKKKKEKKERREMQERQEKLAKVILFIHSSSLLIIIIISSISHDLISVAPFLAIYIE